MRKLFALLIVAGTFAVVSCEKKTEGTSGMDSTANVVETPVDTTTTMAPVDSSAAPMADSSAAK